MGGLDETVKESLFVGFQTKLEKTRDFRQKKNWKKLKVTVFLCILFMQNIDWVLVFCFLFFLSFFSFLFFSFLFFSFVLSLSLSFSAACDSYPSNHHSHNLPNLYTRKNTSLGPIFRLAHHPVKRHVSFHFFLFQFLHNRKREQ